MRLLQDDVGQSLPCVVVVPHVALYPTLLEEFVSGVDVLQAEDVRSLSCEGSHAGYLSTQGVGDDLLTEATSNELDVGIVSVDVPDELLKDRNPGVLVALVC